MRSIGKRNIRKVIALTETIINSGEEGINNITEAVKDRLPPELWDTWEMADQQINRIIADTIMQELRR